MYLLNNLDCGSTDHFLFVPEDKACENFQFISVGFLFQLGHHRGQCRGRHVERGDDRSHDVVVAIISSIDDAIVLSVMDAIHAECIIVAFSSFSSMMEVAAIVYLMVVTSFKSLEVAPMEFVVDVTSVV